MERKNNFKQDCFLIYGRSPAKFHCNEWSFPLTWRRWRSRHSLRHLENLMLHANFMVLYVL